MTPSPSESISTPLINPTGVNAPATPHGVSEIIRVAAARKIPLLPRGSGTAQEIGHPPPANALTLSTKNLVAGLQHEPADMIATVPAGLTLSALQAALQLGKQWLPIDGPADATIGGLIATDRHGPKSLGYGTLRDSVLGMSVVNGDGVLRKCGGKVVKNVTGYPLEKLYIGSLGTLGVITEVTFKLRPLPIARRNWTASATTGDEALSALRKISALCLPLESVTIAAPTPARADWQLDACAAGTDVELDRIGRDITTAIAPLIPVAAVQPTHWSPEPAKPLDNRIAIRFWCRSATLAALLQILERTDWLEIGMTGGTLAMPPDAARAEKFFALLNAEKANYRIERHAGRKIAQPFGPPRPEWQLMQRLKESLDPAGILNPGRFVV